MSLPVDPLDLMARLERAETLDHPAEVVDKVARAAHPSQKLRAAAQGSVVGHPLHAAMSDVPVGAWLSSLLLDLRHPSEARSGADTLLCVAVASALPTAFLGLADFLRLDAEQRRVATVHAAFNSAGLGLGVASLCSRRSGRRAAGVLLSAAGAAFLGAGGFLGGHIASRLGPPSDTAAEVERERPLGQLRTTNSAASASGAAADTSDADDAGTGD